MAYTITTTAGTAIATVTDGTVNTTATNLTLIGKNYAGYGVFLNENYIKLLENFSNGSAPSTPLKGQLWYDATNSVLKVYNGTQWKPISSSATGGTAPTGPVIGDLWWDTANAQLKVWSGSTWVIVGPAYTSTSGTSGGLVETILDNVSGSHVVVRFYVSNTTVGIISKDASFTPLTSIPGFSTIKPGFNLVSSSTITGAQFTGDASNALTLNGLTSGQFLRSDTNISTNYTLDVVNNTGLTVGGSSDFNIGVSGGIVKLTSTVNNADLDIVVNKGGTLTQAVAIDGSTGSVTVPGAFSVGTNATVTGTLGVTGTTSLSTLTISNTFRPTANASINIGSTSYRWNLVYAQSFVGTSVQAQYADLAERFEADQPMLPGTVVELGGIKEITSAVQELSEAVFGVISTKAAFLMNGEAGTDATHPPVAVNGRVPVRVIGSIKKGDRLVSAGRGLARAATKQELTPFNVIGRSLENKSTVGEGIVEAIVKLNS